MTKSGNLEQRGTMALKVFLGITCLALFCIVGTPIFSLTVVLGIPVAGWVVALVIALGAAAASIIPGGMATVTAIFLAASSGALSVEAIALY